MSENNVTLAHSTEAVKEIQTVPLLHEEDNFTSDSFS